MPSVVGTAHITVSPARHPRPLAQPWSIAESAGPSRPPALLEAASPPPPPLFGGWLQLATAGAPSAALCDAAPPPVTCCKVLGVQGDRAQGKAQQGREPQHRQEAPGHAQLVARCCAQVVRLEDQPADEEDCTRSAAQRARARDFRAAWSTAPWPGLARRAASGSERAPGSARDPPLRTEGPLPPSHSSPIMILMVWIKGTSPATCTEATFCPGTGQASATVMARQKDSSSHWATTNSCTLGQSLPSACPIWGCTGLLRAGAGGWLSLPPALAALWMAALGGTCGNAPAQTPSNDWDPRMTQAMLLIRTARQECEQAGGAAGRGPQEGNQALIEPIKAPSEENAE